MAPGGDRRLDSWKEIAAYLRRDVRTVQRWEQNEGLPVHRKRHGTLGSVFAFEQELDAWWNEDRSREAADPAPARWRLAVLPLRNLSGDPAQDYFAEGLTEELQAQLSRGDPQRIAVLARRSVGQVLAKGEGSLARELGATHVLDGSVRRSGERVRLSVQLAHARDHSQVWAQSYDRDLCEILAVQDELAREVTAGITATARAPSSGRFALVDPEAYSACLMGRQLWGRRSVESVSRAVAQFERATALAPGYAPAHAGLADCYAVLANPELGWLPPVEAMPRARSAAERALALDPALGEGFASLGFVRLWFDWDAAGAEESFTRALELWPAHASARQWRAALLAVIDRVDEALAELDRALELDPLSNVLRVERSSILYFERDYENAVRQARAALALDDQLVLARLELARALGEQGRAEEALAVLEPAQALAPGLPALTMALGRAQAAAGRADKARLALAELAALGRQRYVSAFQRAAVHAALGEREATLSALEAAREERCAYVVHLAKEPAADALRGEPRFQALLPSWRPAGPVARGPGRGRLATSGSRTTS
jgi:TolB-like protein/Flp pilus assembly protein TadD